MAITAGKKAIMRVREDALRALQLKQGPGCDPCARRYAVVAESNGATHRDFVRMGAGTLAAGDLVAVAADGTGRRSLRPSSRPGWPGQPACFIPRHAEESWGALGEAAALPSRRAPSRGSRVSNAFRCVRLSARTATSPRCGTACR